MEIRRVVGSVGTIPSHFENPGGTRRDETGHSFKTMRKFGINDDISEKIKFLKTEETFLLRYIHAPL